MRVLIIDCECLGLDFAERCVADGHEVRWYMDSKRPIRDGEGFWGVKRVDDWKPSMAWAKEGLIITTGNAKFLRELDRYRDLGFKIFSPTARSAALEINRGLGMQVMQSVGIEVPHFEQFASLGEAEAYARKSDQAYVFKTLGSEEDKSLSYVSKSPADLVGWLQRQQARGLKLKGPCMLQEKIDMVSEMGVSGWFGPEGFLADKWHICFEYKKLMPGDYGPNTGEMGSACSYAETEKMADEMLVPMEAYLLKAGHRGDFAIGCGVDSAGKAWPFEFTARLGWPAFYIQIAAHKGDVAQWMRDLLDGKDTLKVDYRPAIGVVCAQPPFPTFDGDPAQIEGNPISGVEEVWDQVHPAGMMLEKGPVMQGDKVIDEPTFQTTGEMVLTVTGLGATVSKARAKVYDAIDEISFPDMIVRTDIGAKLEKELPVLHKFGYAPTVEF